MGEHWCGYHTVKQSRQKAAQHTLTECLCIPQKPVDVATALMEVEALHIAVIRL